MRALLFIFIFLAVSGLVIINNHNLYVYQKEDLKSFSQEYNSWIEKIYQNTRSITGQIINMEWIPNTSEIVSETNETISNITEKIPERKNLDPSDDEFWDSIDWEVSQKEPKNKTDSSKE